MRITSEAMVLRSVDRLQGRLGLYERAQTELASGRRILRPSDDPAGARRAMSLNSSLQAREQELANIDDARGWLDMADSQLQSVTTRLSRARELVTNGANSQSLESRQALAAEIRQITEEIAGIANAQHMERPLFGGFGSGEQVTKVAGEWRYPADRTGGAPDQIMRRVSDSEQVRINVTAAEWLGTTDLDATEADGVTPLKGPALLNLLEQIAADLDSGAPSGDISAHIGSIVSATKLVTDSLSQVGAATNRVESARARTMDLQLTLKTELSQVQDLDLAQGMMEMQVQQVAYEATLQALGKALPPSLVAFLR